MTKISIDVVPNHHNYGGVKHVTLSEARLVGLGMGSHRLLKQLGNLGRLVEIIKVESWTRSNSDYVLHDVKVALSLQGKEEQKVKVSAHLDLGRERIHVSGEDPEQIAELMCEQVLPEIYRAVRRHSAALSEVVKRWENVLPAEA